MPITEAVGGTRILTGPTNTVRNTPNRSITPNRNITLNPKFTANLRTTHNPSITTHRSTMLNHSTCLNTNHSGVGTVPLGDTVVGTTNMVTETAIITAENGDAVGIATTIEAAL